MDAPVMTYQPKSDFLRVMIERGFLADCTDMQGFDDALMSGVVPGYIGFDATARSLHVGSLIQIMTLRWLQKTGHKPITLMGGGTTKVGDPSFRADERPLLTAADIDANIAGIKTVFAKYLDYGDGPSGALMLNNAEWLDGSELPRFPARYRAAFLGQPDAQLREREIAPRPGAIAQLPRIQLHDPAGLRFPRAEPPLRLPGAVRGLGPVGQYRQRDRPDAARARRGDLRADDAAPDNVGRQEDGQIRLGRDLAQRRDAEPYEFWQFWRNTTDADVGRFLKLYTELPVEECDRLGALEGSEINEAKIVLANEVTTLCHGAEPPPPPPRPPRARSSRRAAPATTCRRSRSARRRWATASPSRSSSPAPASPSPARRPSASSPMAARG
jgi:tyrosyl-tRNA synthetase